MQHMLTCNSACLLSTADEFYCALRKRVLLQVRARMLVRIDSRTAVRHCISAAVTSFLKKSQGYRSRQNIEGTKILLVRAGVFGLCPMVKPQLPQTGVNQGVSPCTLIGAVRTIWDAFHWVVGIFLSS